MVEQIYDDALAAAAAAVLEPSVSSCPEVRVRWHEMLVVDRDAGHGPGLDGVGKASKSTLPPTEAQCTRRGYAMQSVYLRLICTV